MANETIRERGRPENAKFSDLDSLKARSLHEIAKFDAKMVNKLPQLYAMLEEIAFATGRFKNASVTNRKSSIETLITRGELYAKGEGAAQEAVNSMEGVDKVVEEDQHIESKKVSNGEPVLSYAEKVAEFKKKQADKEGWFEINERYVRYTR